MLTGRTISNINFISKMSRFLIIVLFTIILSPNCICQLLQFYKSGISDNYNISVLRQNASGLVMSFSIAKNMLNELEEKGNIFESSAKRKYLAIPNGANPSVEILSAKHQTLQDNDIISSPVYSKNREMKKLVSFFETIKIRGMDVVALEVNPLQYSTSTKELRIYYELIIEVTFIGGNGHFGDDRLRNRHWDQIYKSIVLNYESISINKISPRPDFSNEGAEYLIIVPDNQAFLQWADSLKHFRTLQGIKTVIVTLSDIGGNDVNKIENFIDHAYNNWVIPPVAVLLLADYGDGIPTGNGIISPIYNNYCVSDNIYADVDGDQLADIVLSRITAQSNSDLESIICKILTYERNPPEISGFYDNPLCVSDWQSSGRSVICSEVIFGFYKNILNKEPTRQYSGYGGGAPSNWPTDPYSVSLFEIFGPNGLGYIPAEPSHLTNWNGNADGINTAINNGAFTVFYRGNGSTDGWAEPSYIISDLSGLNNNYPPFIFSITSLSGKFNGSNDSFAEAFLKQISGALGIIAATEVTYSFVSSDYGWGLYDYLWPQFFPEPPPSSTYRCVLPAFANVAAKYFLQGNNSPFYNQQTKEVTYNLFHHFGDAFSFIYTEIPESLSVVHDSLLLPGVETFSVLADENSLISLSVNGEIIAVETGTGLPLEITIPPQNTGDSMIVTVTKQNYFRYTKAVGIELPSSTEGACNSMNNNFILFQNHPNPFNPSTKIKYSIPQTSNAVIKVFDILGNEIETLVNEEKPIGTYETTWNAEGLPSRVYFYQLKAGDFIQTKKMVLMK
jgi:hypothetical protein